MSLDGTYRVVTESGDDAGILTVSSEGPRTVFELDASPAEEIQKLICLCPDSAVSIGIPVPESGRLKLSKRLTRSQLKEMNLTKIIGVFLMPISVPTPNISSEKASHEESSPPITEIRPTKESTDMGEDGPCETDQPPFKNTECVTENENESENKNESASENSGCDDFHLLPDGWEFESDPARYFKDPDISPLCHGIRGALHCKKDTSDLIAIPIEESTSFPLTTFLCFGSPMQINESRYVVFTIKNGMPV